MKKVREGYKMTEIGEIPEEWEVKKLGELAKIVTGKTPPTKNKEYYGGKYPWVTPTDIKYSRDLKKTERQLTDKGFKKAVQLPANTLLITCIASIGKNAILRKEGSCNQQINAILPNDNFISEFLYYYIDSISTYLESLAGQTAVKIINKTAFENIYIALPPLDEQKKIAQILSTVDESIEKTDEIIEKTKELKKGLMQKLLTKGIGHSKFKMTEIGEIPEEWEVAILGDLVEIRSGLSPSQFELNEEGKHPFFKVNDMNFTSKYLSQSAVYFDSCKYPLMEKGMVVFPKRGASIFTNKICILDTNGFFDTNVMGLKTKVNLYNEYLYYFLLHLGLYQFADTTSVPQINNKHINPIKIPLPPQQEQRQIASILFTVDEKIEAEEKRKEQLLQLKKGLMQQLLTGRVRVKV